MGQKITNEMEVTVKKWWSTFNDSLTNTDRCGYVREATALTLSDNSILRIVKGQLDEHRQYMRNRQALDAHVPGNGGNGTEPVKSYEDTLFAQYAKKQALDDQVATALDNVKTTLQRIEAVLETIAKVYHANQS